LSLAAATAVPSPAPLASVPAGFVDQFVASISLPTALAFTPDGRLLVTSQTGQLWVIENGVKLPAPALDLSARICSQVERGLLGIAVDPGFAVNQYVYLFYTFKVTGCGNTTNVPVNRVSRFTLEASNSISLGSEYVVVDNLPGNSNGHLGGDLAFGADGWLYVTFGDGGVRAQVQGTQWVNGKILRVGADGSIPPDNPYAAAAGARHCTRSVGGVPPGTGPCQEIFARGLRNPFRLAFRPGTHAFYINDVGESTWEEINLGQSDANYGWPAREGPCPLSNADCTPGGQSGYTEPLYYYKHATGCGSITGGAFVPPGIWPVAYDNTYLFADYVCGKIMRLAAGPPLAVMDFVTGLGVNSAVALRFGPHADTQALYYTSYFGPNNAGQIRRVYYTGPANRPPTAQAAAGPLYGAPVPLEITFSAEGSSDPDAGDTLLFDWDFGDGVFLQGATSLTVTHDYTQAGVYTATLVVRDNREAAADPVAITVYPGNLPPQPAIIGYPALPFSHGQVLEWEGESTDLPGDGAPGADLTWQAFFHHIDMALPEGAHQHPVLPPTAGSVVSFTAELHAGLAAGPLSFIELRLTASDPWGLAATITYTVEPEQVPLRFMTDPPGLEVELEGIAYLAPANVTSWPDYAFEAVVPLQTDFDGLAWTFLEWDDAPGLAAARTITTPAAAITYTARLTPSLETPVPVLSGVTPASAPMGGTGITLALTGKYFALGAVARFDGTDLATTFVDNSRLEAQLPSGLLTPGGTVEVVVANPDHVSQPFAFEIWWPQYLPVVSHLGTASD
jgi:glucose/arabinose dehydrogenase/PKD repeat protein